MKNIDIGVVEQYNKDVEDGVQTNENRDTIYNFLQVNIVHLEEDMKRFRKESQLNNYHYLNNLREKAIKLQADFLSNKHIEPMAVKELNKYNNVKNKELVIIAIATAVLLIIAIAFPIITS